MTLFKKNLFNRLNQKILTTNQTFVETILNFLDDSRFLSGLPFGQPFGPVGRRLPMGKVFATQTQREDKRKENFEYSEFKDLNSSYSKLSEIQYVSIGLASNQTIRRWAEKKLPNGKILGEVISANTLHYKTFKPLKGGLFCDRIFGPLKDFECACGNRQRPNQKDYQDLIKNRFVQKQYCPTCDVEYTWSVMRRYQMGYIKLVSPVSHIWYLKANPSYLSILLDMKKRDLENVIYCSETLTLENSWKIVQNFRLSTSPSELFQSWQKILEQKDLKQKNNFLNGYSLKEFEEKKRQSYKQQSHRELNVSYLDKKKSNLKPSKFKILKRFIQMTWKIFYQNAYKMAHFKIIKILKTIFITHNKNDYQKFMYRNKLSQKGSITENEYIRHFNFINYFPLNRAFTNRFMDLFNECLKDYKNKFPITLGNLFLWEILSFFNQPNFLSILNRKMICCYLIKRIQNRSDKKTQIIDFPLSLSTHKNFNLSSNQLNKKMIKNFELNKYVIRLKRIQSCFHERITKRIKNTEFLQYLENMIEMTSFVSFPKKNFKNHDFLKFSPLSLLQTKGMDQRNEELGSLLEKLRSEGVVIDKKVQKMNFINILMNQSILDLMIILSDEFVKIMFKYIFKIYLKKYAIKNKLDGSLNLKLNNHINFQEKFTNGFNCQTLFKTNETLILNFLMYQKHFKQLNWSFIFPYLNNNEEYKNQLIINNHLNVYHSKNQLYIKFLQNLAKIPVLLSNQTVTNFIKYMNPFHNKNLFIRSMIDNIIINQKFEFLGKEFIFIKNHFLTKKTQNLLIQKMPLSNTKIDLKINKSKNRFQTNLCNIKYIKNIKMLFPSKFSKEKYYKFFENPVLKMLYKDILQENRIMRIIDNNDEFIKTTILKDKIVLFSQQFKKNRFIQNLRIPNFIFRNKITIHNLYSQIHIYNCIRSYDCIHIQDEYLNHNNIKPYNNIIKFHQYENLPKKSVFLAKKYMQMDPQKTIFSHRISHLKSNLSLDSLRLNSNNMNKNNSIIFEILNLRNHSSFHKVHKNHIYSLSFLERWSHERNWQYFSDYFLSPRDFDDISIPIYKNQTFNTTYVSNEIQKTTTTGAGMILKLLSEFHIKELEKMNQQNRAFLDQLARQIRFLRTFVKKGFADKKDKKELKQLCEKRDKLMRRMKLTEQIFFKKTNPTSMILTVLPVLPPDLRPILRMQNQMASSDLNRLYQRVIYRNDRLKKFRKDAALTYSFEVKYAQRLLQEAVDHLIQNGKGGTNPERDSRGRALKSLSEILKGKQGRFRQYLLGKRVDYSGRSVIVVGPKLKIHECGLPKEMALELFLPFLIQRILHYKFAKTIIGAKTLIKANIHLTLYLLSEIMQTHPILLNRAPTLHRLGVQAFQAKLIDGRAILLHPLVCPAFNADFDGDQMAVHIPLTIEAKAEAWKLMFSRTHLISSASGEPIMLPSQDMVLGCYYLTTELSLDLIQKKVSNKLDEEDLSFKASQFSLKSIYLTQNFQTDRNQKWIPILRNYLLKNDVFYHQQTYRLNKHAYFNELNDVIKAYQMKKVLVHSNIWVKWQHHVEISHKSIPHEIRISLDGSWQEIQKKQLRYFDSDNNKKYQYIQTTPGRIFFYKCIQQCIS